MSVSWYRLCAEQLVHSVVSPSLWLPSLSPNGEHIHRTEHHKLLPSYQEFAPFMFTRRLIWCCSYFLVCDYTVTQYLLMNATNAQTVKNRTKKETELLVTICLREKVTWESTDQDSYGCHSRMEDNWTQSAASRLQRTWLMNLQRHPCPWYCRGAANAQGWSDQLQRTPRHHVLTRSDSERTASLHSHTTTIIIISYFHRIHIGLKHRPRRRGQGGGTCPLKFGKKYFSGIIM